MKRLFKMLSLLSILLILGSCSSSKSINITQIKSTKQFVKFKSLNDTTYPVIYISIVGADLNINDRFVGDEYEVSRETEYVVSWQYIDKTDNNSFKTVVKTGVVFNFPDSTVMVELGNNVNAWKFTKY